MITTESPSATTANAGSDNASSERADLLQTLRAHRDFLRFTARELSDQQAAQRTTVSALTIGGLIKHVSGTEAAWAAFIVDGPSSFGSWDIESWGAAEFAERAKDFALQPGETLASVLAGYGEVARTTDELVARLDSLDASHPLPEAPWFEPGAHWTARRALLHIIAETAQHAGHADIIRESLDGAKTMG
jgi:Protein of unknown function (DUF664)